MKTMMKYLMLMTVTAILDASLLPYITLLSAGMFYAEHAVEQDGRTKAFSRRQARRQQIMRQASYVELKKAS